MDVTWMSRGRTYNRWYEVNLAGDEKDRTELRKFLIARGS